jgi:tyrosinase
MRSFTLALLLGALTATPCSAGIQVEIGRAGPQDDYLCWGNVDAKIRWDSSGQPPGTVTLRSRPLNGPTSGALGFSPGERPGTERKDELKIDVPSDGAWKHFLVFGAKASSSDKDVALVVAADDGSVLAEYPLMVRVRKNAEKLTTAERDRFLSAFAKAAKKNNQYAKYWGIHSDGVRLAHQFAFLPWHRVFLMNLEREIQAEDPSVALPYWEFDKPAPKLFSRDFIGVVNPQAPGNPVIVDFSATNPLSTWGLSDPRVTPLTREKNGSSEVSSELNKDFMGETEEVVVAQSMFGPYHGEAHVFINGIVGDISRSPADPLFFLLHANVDRAWAAWQRFHNMFDRHQATAYSPQGANQPQSGIATGNFEKDTMWPWDGVPRPTDPVVITIGQIALPPNPGPSEGVAVNPQVGETLDYLGILDISSTQGPCYDDIPFGTGEVTDFWHP